MAGSTSITRSGAGRRLSDRRTTIADVALLAGVHRTTVSAVLNDRPNCYASQKTRRRIREAATRLDYRPSPLARGLVGKRTNTLGLIVTGFGAEMTTRKLSGFEQAARASGRIAFTVNTSNQPNVEDQAIRELLDRGVDAMAIYPTERGPHRELRRLVERGYPVVTFDGRGRLDFSTDDVTVDALAAGRLQAQHLLDRGYRRPAVVVLSPPCHVNTQKLAGFESVMAEKRIDAPRIDVRRISLRACRFSMNMMEVDEFEQMRQPLRQLAGQIDALACPGDLVALSAMRVAAEEGLRVPEDLAVMGIDGIQASAQGNLPLSTVCHDSEQVGRLAMELLEERLAGKRQADAFRQILMAPRVEARASTLGRRR